MTSTSSRGNTSITLQFVLDRDIDAAAQDVQAAISQVVRRLPQGMPNPPQMQKQNPADQAMLFIGSIGGHLTVIALTSDEYAAALEWWSKTPIVGGTIYDALLASCALKAGVETIYTWNQRHYRQLGPEVERRLQLPG